MSALTNFLRKRQKRFKENLVHFYHKHVEPSACYREVCRKRWGGGKYTVISGCYNVEKYIAEFIESIIDQRLLFKDHLFLICVDDGSTDRTAEIIKKYAAKYPENIAEKLEKTVDTTVVDALSAAKEAGNIKAVNVVLIGVMAKMTDIPYEKWVETIKTTVPEKFLDVNLKAFEAGYNL
ncbi:2-oxoacid:acceptor oxidoreductase family protein [Mailhella sp.]|uniref:2-oxoacid:acceptor oxidoreductase family protein n=1 Tax=Mailhella sp. TaxID=1981029 RepID=UPI004062DF80